MFGFTCMLLCICFQRNCAQRTAGASRHPAFPAPSALLRAVTNAKLGHDVPRGGEAARATEIRSALVPRTQCSAPFGGALQSRGPCTSKMRGFWVPALRRTAARCVASGTRMEKMLLPTLRHCKRSDLSAQALAKAEAIQTAAAERFWIASSQELLVRTAERTTAN